MVVTNNYSFYGNHTDRPATSDSRKHFSVPSYDGSMDTSKSAQVTEIPLNDMHKEGVVVRSATIRRSEEIARPKPKPKPRPLDIFVRVCGEQSIVIRGGLIVLLTSLPFLLFLFIALGLPKQYVGSKDLGVSLVRLAKWLIVCWGSFIGLLYCGRVLSMIAYKICCLSTELYRFQGLVREVCLRMTLLIWAGVGYAIMPELFEGLKNPSLAKTADDWIHQLRKGFLFLIVAFAIILVQGVLLQLIKIQYIEGFIGPRAEKACHELEVIQDLHSLVKPHVDSKDIGFWAKLLKRAFMPIDSRDPFYIISRGQGNEDVWNEYAAMIWTSISVNGKDYLTCADLCQRLSYMNRDPDRGQVLFAQLDDSLDGQVTEEEVTALVHKIGLQLNRRTQAMSGIRRLMAKLEIVMTILMLGLIVFVYVQFFAPGLSARIGNLWTGIVGLAFAFSGAVSEFVNSTVYCFGKHPYDIGDYVEIKAKKYIVSNIFLTHTNFEQVQNEHVRGLVCQMSHASLQAEPIINWTRTVEDATRRHSEESTKSGDKTAQREDNVADLIAAKLGYLKSVEAEKTKTE